MFVCVVGQVRDLWPLVGCVSGEWPIQHTMPLFGKSHKSPAELVKNLGDALKVISPACDDKKSLKVSDHQLLLVDELTWWKLALIGTTLALIGTKLALIGTMLALIGTMLALIGTMLALIGTMLALIGTTI